MSSICVNFDIAMKHYRSILSIAFALLVLFSSSSFMVGIHLCSGRVQDVALFTPAKDCGMEKKLMPPCHRHESKPCCENKAIVHEADDFNTSVTSVALSPLPVLDVELPHVLLAEVIPSLQLTPEQFYNYDPPLRPSDITVSLQVFLI
jgi:hypothetical protein